MSPRREPLRRSAPSSRQDRAVAMIVWVISGLLVGLALGVFTGHGWIFLAAGLALGILLAVTRTRPDRTIDED